MLTTESFPLVLTFLVYFIVVITIGIVANRITHNLSDFVLGGRRLSGTIVALGAGASDMSGWLLLALPGAVYAQGINQFWLPLGLVVGAYLNWQFVAKRLRIYTEIAQDSLTIPAFLENRFHDKSRALRVVTAMAILIFFTFYTASGFVSGAVLFQSTFDLDYHVALWIGAVIIIFYTTVGGFLAVSWTDFFQGCLMFVALIVAPFTAAFHLGDWNETFATIAYINPNFLDAFSGISLIGAASLAAWGLGYFGQPHILVRFMAIQNPNEIPKARFICLTWMTVALCGAVAVGFLGIAVFATHPLPNPEEVFLEMAHRLFNPWLAGILLAAVLSAIMSAIAAQLLASASALTEDFYRSILRRNAVSHELVIVSRLTVLAVALIAIVLAYNPNNSILKLVSYAWAGLGASFGPTVLFSLFYARTTRNAAIAGIVSGGLTVIIWKQLSPLGGIFSLYEIIPAFIISSAVILIASLMDKPPAPKILEEFQAVKRALKQ